MNIRQFLNFSIVILGAISALFGNLLLFVMFMVFGVIIVELFVKFNNYNKKLYVTTVTIFLFLSTIIYSTLTNNLTSFETYVPFFAGFLVAIAVTWDLEKIKLIKEGLILINTKKFPEALNKFDRVLKLDPENLVSRLNRAEILGKMKRYDEELDEVDKILKIYADDLLALNIRSHTLLKLGEKDEALGIVEQILEKSPKNQAIMAITLSNKGEILFEKEDYLESISCYDEALAKIPSKKVRIRKGFKFITVWFMDHQIAEIWFNKKSSPKASTI